MLSTFSEDQDELEISNIFNKSPIINIGENINIYFDQKMVNISLSPILPINKIDILLKLYNLNISKEDLEKRIIKILNGENSNKVQAYLQNGTKIQKGNNQIKIIDDLFLKDCTILSKASKEGAFIIADRISKILFRETINYKYEINKENNKKYVIAYLNFKENQYIESDFSENRKEAKLNVSKKIINKYLPKKNAKEIINNINECIQKEEKSKDEKRARYEQILIEAGGNRQLLRNKRKITREEFSRRLPYFNMLDKDKNKDKEKNEININNLMEEEYEEIFFMNTENSPINEILLGDLGIVDNHLKDFKYTPLKMFEMIRDSEKKRGVELKIEYTQVNDKNYCHNSEAIIFSQKLGLKVEGFGKSKEEAENKCALNMLAIIFKNKFTTYFQLHDYFEHKNGKYLDIILIDENEEENDEKKEKEKEKEQNELNTNSNNNKKKKIEENYNKENNINININNDIIKNGENEEENIENNKNVEIIESIPIYFKNNNLSFENIVESNTNSEVNTDAVETIDNLNSEINNNINNFNNPNRNYNIGTNFGKLFNCNIYNNYNFNDSNGSSNISNIINSELNEELKNNTKSSSSKGSQKSIKKKKRK